MHREIFKHYTKVKILNNKLSNREKLNYLFKRLPEKQINFSEIKYSISDDVDKILEDIKTQIRNRRIFIPEKNKEKGDELSYFSKIFEQTSGHLFSRKRMLPIEHF